MQRAPCGAVMLAGRLHDDAGDRKGRKHPLQPFQADAVVADAKRLAGRMDMHVQPLFTHVDTGIDWRRVRFGHCLALHAGLAPHHLFRTTRRTNGPTSSTGHRPKGSRPSDPRRMAVRRGSQRSSHRRCRTNMQGVLRGARRGRQDAVSACFFAVVLRPAPLIRPFGAPSPAGGEGGAPCAAAHRRGVPAWMPGSRPGMTRRGRPPP